MSLYGYTGYNPNGKTVSGVIDAEDQVTARHSLRDRGIFLTELLDERKKTPSSIVSRLRWGRRPGLKDLSLFTYQLKTLLISALPVVDALTVLVDEEQNGRFKAVLAGVRDKVKDGEAIATAFSSYPDVFNDLYVNMVAAGDAGGMLEEALDHLLRHLERQEKVSTRVRAAMTYPAFMALVGFVILSYLLTSVVPKVVTVFQDVNKALPLPTRVLITVSGVLSRYWPVIFALIAVIAYGGYRFSKQERGRRIIERVVDHLPYVGGMLRAMQTARFGRTMEALLKGGVPLSRALGITSKAAGHLGMAKVLSRAEEAVLEGGSLTDSLRESRFFPKSALSLMTVGETGGNFEEVFARIGEAKERELDGRLETLLTLLEPVMILCMGVVVGFIVFAILLPMLEMSHLG
jgi:type II secretory pathway component PulF